MVIDNQSSDSVELKNYTINATCETVSAAKVSR